MAKSNIPIVVIHNVETGEIIEREMNAHELAQYEIDKAEAKAIKTEMEAKAQAKTALLAKFGLTENEAKLLLS